MLFFIKNALAAVTMCGSIAAACAQAPPADHGLAPIWSSHDRQLYRPGGPVPVPVPLYGAEAGTAGALLADDVLTCEPQTLLELDRLLADRNSGRAETTGAGPSPDAPGPMRN